MLVEWTKEFEICEEIDSQHKKLFDIINEFYDAFLFSSQKESIKNALDELRLYATYHFNFEEELFAKKKYYLSSLHILEHREFEKKIKSFSERFNHNDISLSNDIMIYLKNWLLTHVLGDDKEYKDIVCD